MRADIAGVRTAHREEPAVLVEGELRIHREVAALVIADKRFAAVRRPLDGMAETLRGPGHEGEFRIERVPGAVISSHIGGHHPHPVLRHAEYFGELALRPNHPAAAGMEGIAAGLGVERGDGGPWFHRNAGPPAGSGFPCERRDGRPRRRVRSPPCRPRPHRRRRSTPGLPRAGAHRQCTHRCPRSPLATVRSRCPGARARLSRRRGSRLLPSPTASPTKRAPSAGKGNGRTSRLGEPSRLTSSISGGLVGRRSVGDASQTVLQQILSGKHGKDAPERRGLPRSQCSGCGAWAWGERAIAA